jgi:hypothetical protein
LLWIRPARDRSRCGRHPAGVFDLGRTMLHLIARVVASALAAIISRLPPPPSEG